MNKEEKNELNSANDEKYDVFITTFDNPYDPTVDINKWMNADHQLGYDSCEYLARMMNYDPDMSEEELVEAKEDAIDRIIALENVDTVIYKKIKVPKTEKEFVIEEE